MRKALIIVYAIIVLNQSVFAQHDAPQSGFATKAIELQVNLSGTLVDNVCAVANKDTLAEFLKTHSKECALKPECMESGYSLFADGELYALDDASNATVIEFLKCPQNKPDVKIEGILLNEKLTIKSITN